MQQGQGRVRAEGVSGYIVLGRRKDSQTCTFSQSKKGHKRCEDEGLSHNMPHGTIGPPYVGRSKALLHAAQSKHLWSPSARSVLTRLCCKESPAERSAITPDCSNNGGGSCTIAASTAAVASWLPSRMASPSRPAGAPKHGTFYSELFAKTPCNCSKPLWYTNIQS